MSTPARPPHPSEAGGPYLAMAVLCEKVLQEQDGVLSVIRAFDRVTQTATGPEAPEQMPALTVSLTLLVILKSGSARGRHQLLIRLEGPSGQALGTELQMPVLLEGEGDRGNNFVLQLQFVAEEEGLHWFDVVFDDDRLLTRVPLRIVYQPQRLG